MSAEFGKAVYRIRTRDGVVEILTVGRLEKAEGLFVLHVSAGLDQAHLLQEAAKRKSEAVIYVEVADEVVGVMRAGKIGAHSKDGRTVDLWIVVGPAI